MTLELSPRLAMHLRNLSLLSPCKTTALMRHSGYKRTDISSTLWQLKSLGLAEKMDCFGGPLWSATEAAKHFSQPDEG